MRSFLKTSLLPCLLLLAWPAKVVISSNSARKSLIQTKNDNLFGNVNSNIKHDSRQNGDKDINYKTLTLLQKNNHKREKKIQNADNLKFKQVGTINKQNTTCFKPTLENFPRDLFSDKDRKNGVIALHVAISIYLFSVLAMLIQAYLMGAIKTMADNFRIASDSARNTITVVASLLPEFCCSLIGIFVSKGNIGAATVIGSCAANSLLTLGVVGLLISEPVKLSWYPLWRDNIFYMVTVTILLWTSYDHELRWQECLFLVAVYLVYLLIINFNHKVERGVRRIVLIYRTGDDEQEADQELEKTPRIGMFVGYHFPPLINTNVFCQ